MARPGYVVVDIGLGVDQGHGYGTLDGQQFTRVTADPEDSITDSFVLDISTRYGRNRFIHGDFETGTATIVLNNDTGEWSPNSGVNNIGGDKLRPGMIVRVAYRTTVADSMGWLNTNTTPTGWSFGKRDMADAETWTGMVDGSTWTNHGTANDLRVKYYLAPDQGWIRFQGRIYSIEDQYEHGGRGAVTVVNVVDFMADLAQYEPGPLSSPFPVQQTSARFSSIFAIAINDGLMVYPPQPGIYDVEASALPSNYLEEARVAARAEGGAVFADHGTEGRLVFKAANWLITDKRSATVQQYVGTARVGVVSASTSYTLGRVFNSLVYQNSTVSHTKTDAASIAEYSTRSLNRTILNNSSTDLESIAVRDLAILKDAKLVITEIELHPENVFEVFWATQVTIGDLLEVTILNNGWEYTQRLHVAGISNHWNAASNDWTLTLRLDSRDGDTVLT